MNDNEFNLLSEIKKQIERLDGKASILSAISGVLLGMSFGWVPILKDTLDLSMKVTKYFIYVFITLYILFLCLSILIFICSIFPRNKPKKIDNIKTNNSVLYYKDLQKMKVNNIKEKMLQNQENCLSEEIKINSMIATKKHKMLVYGIVFLILSILTILIAALFYVFI